MCHKYRLSWLLQLPIAIVIFWYLIIVSTDSLASVSGNTELQSVMKFSLLVGTFCRYWLSVSAWIYGEISFCAIRTVLKLCLYEYFHSNLIWNHDWIYFKNGNKCDSEVQWLKRKLSWCHKKRFSFSYLMKVSFSAMISCFVADRKASRSKKLALTMLSIFLEV